MYRKDVDEEDLRAEIFNLRKNIARVCSENQILKVKIRRLQDEMISRDKQLDEFLNSKRVFGINKDLQEKGVSVLLNLKMKNEKLEQNILEKDLTIKRLQNTLQTAKLYKANSFSKKFASKGVECELITDNKSVCQKKGKLDTKIELRIPGFDMDRLKEMEDNLRSEDELTVSGMKLNSSKTRLFMDMNFDMNQAIEPSYYSDATHRITPSYYSEARYSSKSASYQMGRRDSQSSYTIEKHEMSRSNLHIGLSAEEDSRSDKFRLEEKQLRDGTRLSSSYRTIARSVERLMSQDSVCVSRNNKLSEDKSMQFPIERSDGTQKTTTNTPLDGRNTEAVDSLMDLIHNPKFRRDIENFEHQYLPNAPPEIQVQDQSDLEAASISEKTDKMEKTEIQFEQKEQQTAAVEAPHQEIKQLEAHLMDMITQVDILKSTISKMKVDQQKTEYDLKSKDENIEKLAKEIEQLRELKSISVIGINKYSSTAVISVEPAEKDTDELNICESLQKATESNVKKIAGKIKDLKSSKSKASLQSLGKLSRSSSKRSKLDKRKSFDRTNQKITEKKMLKPYEPKKAFGLGSGDVDIPFFRFGMSRTCHVSKQTIRSEFDELD